MHIVWDQVPRWSKEVNDRKGKKPASEASETTDWGRLFPPQSPDRLALAPLLETFRFEDESHYED